MADQRIMFIAGEVSGDARCAGLITALKSLCQERSQPVPAMFGAGGERMAAAGVELAVNMTAHAVIGHVAAIQGYLRFKKLFDQLLTLASERKPDAVVLVDFSGFNLRFARAIRQRAQAGWRPRIIYFVSPQLWASRPGRARQMEQDVDLLLSIIPFEQAWYSEHAPGLRVEFVGHPLVEEFCEAPKADAVGKGPPFVVLLPGSRKQEVQAHLPVMLDALSLIRARTPIRAKLHLPNAKLEQLARTMTASVDDLEIRHGELRQSLAGAALAITKSGTISLECALLRVPAVVIYITSPLLYYLGRRIVNVPHLAMPNLLTTTPVYPELIQFAATPSAIAREGLALLNDPERRESVQRQLDQIVTSLGKPGASRRAAEAVLRELTAP